MNIVFDSIELHNFMSYENATINLSNEGYVLVSGKNENTTDAATSNGSGKSALFEAISFALTGETIRGSKNVSNINGDGSYFVCLSFFVDNKHYVIKRWKDSTQHLKLIIDDEDISGKGIRDTEKLLGDWLPDVTSSLIGSVIILGQGLPQRFTNNTPSGRKELLEKLSKTNFMIDDIKSRITDRTFQLQGLLREIENKILVLESSLNVNKSNLGNIQTNINILENKDSIVDQLKERKKLLDRVTQEQMDLTVECVELQQQIQFYDEKRDSLGKELNAKKESFEKEKDSKLKPLEDRLSNINIELGIVRGKLNEIESIKDFCPTCGQKIVGVTKPDKSQYVEKLESLREEKSSIQKQLEQLEKELDEGFLKSEKENQEAYSRCGVILRGSHTRLSNIQSTLLPNSNQVLMDTKAYVVELQSRLEHMESHRISLTKQLDDLKDKIADDEKEVENLNKEKDAMLNKLGIMSKFSTLSNRDFRGVLLKNVIDCVNSFCSKFSKEIFGGEKVYLELDGNNLDVKFDTKTYELLSTGERLKCDIIVQLAIREMMCKYLNFSCNIIVLDELFDGLDITGCEKVLNLLFNRLGVDLTSVFIITHRNDLPVMMSCDKTIQVVKNSRGFSSIYGV